MKGITEKKKLNIKEKKLFMNGRQPFYKITFPCLTFLFYCIIIIHRNLTKVKCLNKCFDFFV